MRDVLHLSSYVDDNGRSPNSAALGEEIATPQTWGRRRVIGDAIASGLTPEGLASVLHRATMGDIRAYLTLAEEMEERYLHYASQLQTRRLAIDGIPVSIEHDDKVPKKIVDAVNELVEPSSFDEMTGTLSDAIAKSYSVSEIVWDYSNRLLRPVRHIWRDPRFFQFDEATQTELRLADDSAPANGLPLEAAKFIVHMPRSKMGLPIRRGLARPAGWAFLVQAFTLKDWASFAEIYGVPLRIGKYGANASADDRRALLRAVRDIANDAAAIIPAGMEVEFVKVEGQHGAAVFGGLIDYLDKQVSKLVLGQTMTSDDGASMAQAKVHNEVRLDILAADAKQLAQTLNRDLIIPFVTMNFGPQENYPRAAYHVAEPEDLEGLGNYVSRLVPLGLKVSQREMRERGGLSEPEDDEDLLVAPAAAPAAPPALGSPPAGGKPAALSAHARRCDCAACALAALAADAPAEDAVDEVEQLAVAALGEWEEISDPILAPLRRILHEETTFEGVLKRLETEHPDTRRLVTELAKATAIARGIGDMEN